MPLNNLREWSLNFWESEGWKDPGMLYTSSKGTATHVQSQPTLSAQSKTACNVASVCFLFDQTFCFCKSV